MLEADKSLTAKLLATENITVSQEKVSTASFDVKNRVLRLPMWTDTDADTLDHLIGHEVGHALFTPLDGWHDAVCEKGPSYKSYLNVIEDARIEKLIQRRYPGLRSSFIRSYRKLFANGFFGADLATINNMGLIDRINVYFKCGQSAGVKFDIDERVWLERIDIAETWNDVVTIADELFAIEKEKAEQRREEQKQQQADYSDDEDDEEFEDDSWGDASESDGEMDEFDELFQDTSSGSGESADDEDEEEGDDESEQTSAPAGGSAGNAETDIESKTDSALRDSIDRELNSSFDGQVVNLRINDVSSTYHERIVSYKELLENPHRRDSSYSDYGDQWRAEHDAEVLNATTAYGEACYNHWLNTNKRHVMHMVKEFEMRKRASEYARTQTSKTGVIDTLKMNNYKFSDDIFKKVSIVPEGKNHGFIMYVDMSGSMADYMYQTIEQVMLLAHFCQQINVPYRVYGFSNAAISGCAYDVDVAVGEAADHVGVELLELFTNKMKKSDMVKMSQLLLGSYIRYRATRCRRKEKDAWYNRIVHQWGLQWRQLRLVGLPCFDLGGTPLNHALINAIPLAMDFRKTHRIDILNTFFLTDGESHPLEWTVIEPNENRKVRSTLRWLGNKAFVYINDPYTGLRVGERGNYIKETETLLSIYRRATGSNVIGYRIDQRTRRNLDWFIERNIGGWSASDDQWAQWRQNGYLSVESKAYDDLFLIADTSLNISDNNMEDVKAGDSKAKLRRAFSKSKTDGKASRKMVVDLMKRVA